MAELSIPLMSLKSQFITSVPMVEWAASMGCIWLNLKFVNIAAWRGLLEVLQWLRGEDPPCPWSEDTCSEAAGGGHLEVLQWLRGQDPPCPWDKVQCTDLAAGGGHVEVELWLNAQPDAP